MFCNFLNSKNAHSVNGNACNLSYLHDSSSEKFINHYFSRTAALWTGFCLRHLGKKLFAKGQILITILGRLRHCSPANRFLRLSQLYAFTHYKKGNIIC